MVNSNVRITWISKDNFVNRSMSGIGLRWLIGKTNYQNYTKYM